MKNLVGWILSVVKDPYFSSASVLLFWATAFTVSLLWTLGLEFLPLIDKGHLLVLLAFYVSAAVVVVRIVFGMVQMLIAATNNSVEDSIGSDLVARIKLRPNHRSYSADQISSIAQRIARKNRGRNWYWYLVLGLPLAIPVMALPAWSYRDLAVQLFSWRTFDLLTYAGLGLGFWFTAMIFRLKGRHESAYRYPLAVAHIMFLLSATKAGSTWVWYLQEKAPRIEATITQRNEPQLISIVLPATEGFLAFIEDSKTPEFLPWARVIELRAANIDDGDEGASK